MKNETKNTIETNLYTIYCSSSW